MNFAEFIARHPGAVQDLCNGHPAVQTWGDLYKLTRAGGDEVVVAGRKLWNEYAYDDSDLPDPWV